MSTDIHIIKVTLNGQDVQQAVSNACGDQAARDRPRRLVSTCVVATAGDSELLLFFELFKQD